jgi:hypothetical protein
MFIVRGNSRRIKQSPIVHNVISWVEACYPIDKKQPEFFNLLPQLILRLKSLWQ